MKLEKGKVYYRSDKEAWEYVQKNDVGWVAIFFDDGITGMYQTPVEMENEDYAFVLPPDPPKPKSLYEKVKELKLFGAKHPLSEAELGYNEAIYDAIRIIKEHES